MSQGIGYNPCFESCWIQVFLSGKFGIHLWSLTPPYHNFYSTHSLILCSLSLIPSSPSPFNSMYPLIRCPNLPSLHSTSPYPTTPYHPMSSHLTPPPPCSITSFHIPSPCHLILHSIPRQLPSPHAFPTPSHIPSVYVTSLYPTRSTLSLSHHLTVWPTALQLTSLSHRSSRWSHSYILPVHEPYHLNLRQLIPYPLNPPPIPYPSSHSPLNLHHPFLHPHISSSHPPGPNGVTVPPYHTHTHTLSFSFTTIIKFWLLLVDIHQ